LKKAVEERLALDAAGKDKLLTIWESLKINGDISKTADEKVTAIENCFEEIIECLKKNIDQISDAVTGSAEGKAKKKKKSDMADWEKEIDDIVKAGGKKMSALGKILQKVFDGGKALDLALFGRMLADMPEKNQYASCQVAHAISTHAIEREFDFYTAIDDLKPEDTAGSDMMGTIEFNSACLYRYAVVDVEKLAENLQGDVDLAHVGLRAFLEGFVVSEPTGKQNSFAAHNPPKYVLVCVRKSGLPRNLANAFEDPVRVKGEESLTKKSIQHLGAEYECLVRAYGDEGKAFFMDLSKSEVKIGEEKNSLKDLLDAVITEVGKGA
jgi:CRISPR-associated protein Cas7/Cse4/CasC subtype I-E